MNARLYLFGFLLLVVACRPASPGGPAAPSAVPTSATLQGETTTATAVPSPAPASTPLRLSLPTPAAAPHVSWRPPLYPTPWAAAPHDHFYLARPIAADEVNWPLASYRYGGVFFSPDVPHTGIDIPAKRGTPVLAAGGGTVIWAGWGFYSGNSQDTGDPYGRAVAIRHDFGYQGKTLYTVYGHMDEIFVVRGQRVDVGQEIGLVGDTGFTTGPHLHFEVRMDDNSFFRTYNPELWLVPPQGWGVLAGRIMAANRSPLRQATLTLTSEDGQVWRIRTYGVGVIHSDPYYNENMVLSDLPAGIYTLRYQYKYRVYETPVTIFPGRVTYITFLGYHGFQTLPPPTPALDVLTP